MKKLCILLASAAILYAGAMSVATADDEDKPKPSIKDVMKKCMKGGLCKKVAGGQASDDEKKQLLVCFTALSKNKPPKGDADSWKKLTGSLVAAAKKAVDGADDAGDSLKKAANCAACHKVHKPSKPS